MLRCLIAVFCFVASISLSSKEENFILIDGKSGETLLASGPHLDEPMSPCSTFKIALSLMGYDARILDNAQSPVWNFQEGYDDFLESWRQPLSPLAWMQYSCVWYSKVLALKLGISKIEDYLLRFEYGNRNTSGGVTLHGPEAFWIHSSLKISPREQVGFISRVFNGNLFISKDAVDMTRTLLFKEELSGGWRLFGKTGWCGSIGKFDDSIQEYSWFVGWIERGDRVLPFAYQIRDKKIDLAQRIPRVKELLASSVMID